MNDDERDDERLCGAAITIFQPRDTYLAFLFTPLSSPDIYESTSCAAIFRRPQDVDDRETSSRRRSGNVFRIDEDTPRDTPSFFFFF